MPVIPILIICVYLLTYQRCKRRLAASDQQLKPCISWAKSLGLPLPKRPSFWEFYVVSIHGFIGFLRFLVDLIFGIFLKNFDFTKIVEHYEKEMKLLFEKWNLEKNN
tara:strand:- start:131 stop:451 length:321 start_codon:yes stop_codon:yes gene_type:complete